MSGGLEYIFLSTGLLLIGSGAAAIARPNLLARRNRDHIESGREDYFEERRAWEHYGRPSTDPDVIRRGGWLAVIMGVAAILLMSPVSIFHWS